MSYDFSSLQNQLEKALDHVAKDINTLRTGKATPQLLDPVEVEAYGTRMKLNEVANVSAPDPTLLVITPWDKSIIEAVEKAVASSGLNLNPVVEGELVRIAVPPLTEERRKEMVKVLHQKIEAGRIMIRNIRVDEKKKIEQLEGKDDVSEDDVRSYLSQLEDTVKKTLSNLEELFNKKERELMTV